MAPGTRTSDGLRASLTPARGGVSFARGVSFAERGVAHARRCLAAALVVGIVCSAVTAAAQTGEDGRARAEQLLRQGMQRREAGRDSEALELYRQAVELQPENARALAHLGVTYQALGRWVPAQNYLKQALAHTEDSYIQRHEGELSDALGVVSGKLGQLEVYGGPPGAEVLLNGQPVARLPMSEPLQVTVGSYLLEVQAAGHYTLGRPINVQPRQLTREEVGLAPHRPGGARAPNGQGSRRQAPASSAVRSEQRGSDEQGSEEQIVADAGGGAPRWLPWVLGGAAVASGTGTLIAWQLREKYADRWNDDQACLGVGISRQARCGAELDHGRRAETVAWITGGAAGLLAAGAVLSFVWAEPAEEQVGLSGCAPGLGGAVC
ncbi:MAG: Tetratricopeptide repeat, partial [Pseudomonadota bacterium]